ncbi:MULTISPECIES: Lcl C-terminal domain-containing protein [Paraburkholderia]|uniref:DUF1566 domain-containing protein n=1 Tax=Paraburkholderia TaxID=1822464 RepID=UPI002253F853|nr:MULTISPECIES: DUF1566 domain-containing protein [Paraburkholderia]MCX4154959.1 DUF1566 domain-containing protein [Paraburkholderia aspalathi]MDN7164371.1 DUF1566 domain-containing protein [Paraburkholderia sp. SECH2]MDQ6392856.1 DUF1566 domain-containing protein [Paraburkholderia aspalathi]
MTITLEAIKAEHTKVGEMIAAFERQAATTVYHIEAHAIELAPGERYAGLILGENGEADYHLILLPGEVEEVNWESAGKWAAEHGCVLPTRREQSLLFANLKGEFQSAYYWSGQQHETNSGWAWSQYFGDGTQGCHHTLTELRARAVRRLVLQ